MMMNNLTNFIGILPTCQRKYQDFMKDVKVDELTKALNYLKSTII